MSTTVVNQSSIRINHIFDLVEVACLGDELVVLQVLVRPLQRLGQQQLALGGLALGREHQGRHKHRASPALDAVNHQQHSAQLIRKESLILYYVYTYVSFIYT